MTSALKTSSPDLTAARFHMVDSQIRPNKVRDERILTVMETLPRENFVPPQLAGIAYIDEDIQVAPGRYLLEPMVLARLAQEANISADDRVLDIAPATGYSTALLAALARDVTGVESDINLQNKAAVNLVTLQIKNAAVQNGALSAGFKAKAPFDVIIINGGVEIVPDAILSQLADGGRLLAVLREFGPAQAAHTGEARIYEKIGGAVSSRALFDANVKPLPEFAAAKTFSF